MIISKSIRNLLILAFSLSNFKSYGGIVGNFENRQNLPGYIDLDKRSPWFRGVIKLKEKDDGIERRTPSAILADFFSHGHLNEHKIDLLITQIEQKRKDTFIGYCMRKLPKEADSNFYCLGDEFDDKFLKKWDKYKLNKSLKAAIKDLEEAKNLGRDLSISDLNHSKSYGFQTKLFHALEIYEAIKSEDEQRGIHSGAEGMLRNFVKNYFLDPVKITSGRAEAANLPIPEEYKSRFPDQVFLSRQNIRKLKNDGYDLSLIDPLDSPMWRRPQKAIRSFDLKTYDMQIKSGLNHELKDEEIENLVRPEETLDLVYEPGKFKGGNTAKLYARMKNYEKGSEWKVKYLVDKVGGFNSTNLFDIGEMLLNAAEVNVESVVNNLAAAIGYTVDPTYYKQKVRLFLPDTVYSENRFDDAYEEMIKEIEDSFDGKPMFIRTALKKVKTDKKTGKKYIEIRGVALEKKGDPNTDENIGFFVRHGLGKSLKREHRAFAIFLSWIDDIDIKDENVELKIIPGNGKFKNDYHLAFSNSDMGAAIGHGMPNFYPKEWVKKTKERHGRLRSLKLRYQRLYPLKMLDAVSFSDAKWVMRRIAQFRYDQIVELLEYNGFPRPVSLYYAQLMMGRRNQMLRSLGMIGETIIDDSGNKFVIQEEKEFKGTIEGYEEFFEDGFLKDPENRLHKPKAESFPRHWGAYWTPKVKGKPQSLVYKHVALQLLNSGLAMVENILQPGLYYTKRNLAFTGITLTSSTFGGGSNACDNAKCFFQGIGVGVGTFIPLRFIVKNPDIYSSEPFLIVDLFRIGLHVGTGNTRLEELFDFNVPLNGSIRANARTFKIYEFIKIRAVSNIEKYAEDYGSVFKTPRLMFTKAKQQFVDSMEPGDTLILSAYTGVRGTLRATASAQAFSFIGPQMTLRAGGTLVSRVTIHKETDDIVLANWAKLKNADISAALGLKLGFNIDFISTQRKWIADTERTFAFDFTDHSERSYLMNNLTAFYPKDVPSEYSVKKRVHRLKQNHFHAGIFNFLRRDHYSRKTEVDFYNYLTKEKSKELAFEREFDYRRNQGIINVNDRSYRYKASINDKQDLFIKISLDLVKPDAREKNFLRVRRRILPLVPDDFMVFRPYAVKEYMGELEFKGYIIFAKKALDIIFNLDNKKLCHAYIRVNPMEDGHEVCKSGHYSKIAPLWAFMTDYKQAKKKYDELVGYNKFNAKMLHLNSRQIFKKLKEFVDVFSRYNQKRQIVKIFKDFLPEDSYLQKAIFTSSLKGFPDDVYEIEVTPKSGGFLNPTFRHLAETTEEVYELFSDELHKKLQPLMFDRYQN